MPNPLFNALGGGMSPAPSGAPGNRMGQLIQGLQQFRNQFSGDPQQIVMNAVRSGRITQDQLNQAQSMATQIQRMLGGR